MLGVIVSLFSACERVEEQAKENVYPWQITVQTDGKTQIFGITLNETSLQDAASLLGRDYKLGLFQTSGQPLSLEAYFNEITMGGISGKFVLTLDATQEEMQALLAKAIKRKVLESGTKRYSLTADVINTLAQKPVTSISYIPYINLDEEVIKQRFGEPAERIVIDQKRQHWLYPEYGLDLLHDADGKELLQYVVPADFEELRQPLIEKDSP